jgi:hypothetical protein
VIAFGLIFFFNVFLEPEAARPGASASDAGLAGTGIVSSCRSEEIYFALVLSQHQPVFGIERSNGVSCNAGRAHCSGKRHRLANGRQEEQIAALLVDISSTEI